MPAGDLVVSDYQFEIRSTLLGYGTDYEMERPGPQGLGNRVKDQDVDLRHDDGSYAGTDRLESRVLTIPIEIAGTASAAGAAFKTLNDTTWAPSATDLQLHMQLPGLGKFSVYGRPRGVLEDMTNADFGIIRCQLYFKMNDPTITYV